MPDMVISSSGVGFNFRTTGNDIALSGRGKAEIPDGFMSIL
jgi:hypothetical protein